MVAISVPVPAQRFYENQRQIVARLRATKEALERRSSGGRGIKRPGQSGLSHRPESDTDVPYPGTEAGKFEGPKRRVKAGGTGGDAEAKVAKKIRGMSFEENENNAMGL